MERIVERDNLRLAFLRAAKGRRNQENVRRFSESLEENLAELGSALWRGCFPVGEYATFTIHDPKERTIHAARFPERVMHHAVMNICGPVFDRLMIDESYACRKGKGSWAAVERAAAYAGRSDWFLKMDIRKYFDSIDHVVLNELLKERIKDRGLLTLFGKIIGGFNGPPDKGIPIGSLTSQYFANLYLCPLDRLMKEQWKCRSYVRYMDDIIVWSRSRGELKRIKDNVRSFLQERLRLRLKPEPFINRTSLGMDFLGYRIFPHRIRLSRRSTRRFLLKMRFYETRFALGELTELELQKRVSALTAFLWKADSKGFRKCYITQQGSGQRARTG